MHYSFIVEFQIIDREHSWSLFMVEGHGIYYSHVGEVQIIAGEHTACM